jgi:hypothetical protein
MSNLSYVFVHALAKVSIELIEIYFDSFEIFKIQIGEMLAGDSPKFSRDKSKWESR